MKNSLFLALVKPTINFINFYQKHNVNRRKFSNIKYRIVTSIEEFKKSNLIQLSFTDNPGDLLPPMSIKKIKESPDLINEMHPVDINSINDLYYMAKDNIVSIKVEEDCISAIKKDGSSIIYRADDYIDPDKITSPRLSYMVGFMQAEKITKSIYVNHSKYRVVKDHITTLEIKNLEEDYNFLKNPLEILFSNDYKDFSKEDIARIGFICGHMSKP